MSTELAAPIISEDLAVEIARLQKDKDIRYARFQAKETQAFLKTLKEKTKEVDGFWGFTLSQHRDLAPFITLSSDVDALKHLTDIELVQDVEDPRAYELVFHFKENPYFSNAKLSKKYALPKDSEAAPKDGSISDDLREFDPEDLVSSGTKIEWKDGKNLCEKHPRHIHEEGEEHDHEHDDTFDGDVGSFFWYFATDDDPFSFGTVLTYDLLPEAVDYFNGEGENSINEPGEEFDSDDEDEDDDDEEDEIDLEEEEVKPPKKKARTNGQ
ncbi:Nucleosome assembly protein 1-like 1 [Cryptotrichosporon argae]